MNSTSVLSVGNSDLSSLSKEEASKNLFSQIHWEEVLRSGVALQHRDHQLIERAQANLAVVLDNKQDAQDLASILIKIASNCGSNLTLMRYAFTRIEEILGLGADSADADREVFGLKNAKYFIDNGVVMDGPFIKALNSNDQYLLKSASLGVAHLYAVCENGNIQGLIQWILSKITAVGENVWEIALPSLLVLVRGEAGRRLFIGTGGVGFVLQLLNRLGSTGSSQKIYDLCFILWTLTLSIQEENIQHFATGGLVTTLVTFLASAPSRKVARVCIFALKNLSSYGNSEIITEMLAANLEKVLGNVMQSALCKDSHDDELDNDVKFLNEVLVKNYRDLSTYDRWVSEVHSGALHWGIIHSDKFWKENARLLEQHDFDNLKRLIEILRNASDPNVACVALYDLGEFTRNYPNGRIVVSRLGGKDIAMEKIGDMNTEVQKFALQCVSKLMVNNWEYMK